MQYRSLYVSSSRIHCTKFLRFKRCYKKSISQFNNQIIVDFDCMIFSDLSNILFFVSNFHEKYLLCHS